MTWEIISLRNSRMSWLSLFVVPPVSGKIAIHGLVLTPLIGIWPWPFLDVDECGRGQYHCPTYTQCQNVMGSYTCECQPGFKSNPQNPSQCQGTMYCIVLYCIVLYCIVSYCIVLNSIVLYCIVLNSIVLLSAQTCFLSRKRVFPLTKKKLSRN